MSPHSFSPAELGLTAAVVNVLLHLYAVHAFPPTSSPGHLEAARGYALANGDGLPAADDQGSEVRTKHRTNGNVNISDLERRRAKEAEEYELDALISDSEDGHEHRAKRPAATRSDEEEEVDAQTPVRLR